MTPEELYEIKQHAALLHSYDGELSRLTAHYLDIAIKTIELLRRDNRQWEADYKKLKALYVDLNELRGGGKDD